MDTLQRRLTYPMVIVEDRTWADQVVALGALHGAGAWHVLAAGAALARTGQEDALVRASGLRSRHGHGGESADGEAEEELHLERLWCGTRADSKGHA